MAIQIFLAINRMTHEARKISWQTLPGVIIITALLVAGCKEDNKTEPLSALTGRVVYGDTPVGVRSNGVELELWQPGYALEQKIPVYINQDGAFSAVLADGTYKLTLLKGNGPWEDNTDTISVELHGAASVDVPVVPFYMIEEEAFSLSGSTVSATFTLNQITTSRTVEKVSLFVGITNIVDANNNALTVEIPGNELGDPALSHELQGELSDALKKGRYVFARLGVKTTGVAEMMYSRVQKLSF